MPLQISNLLIDKKGANQLDLKVTLILTYSWLGLKSSFVPKKAFTPKIKSTIAKLAFLYGIDPLEMQKLTIGAVFDDEIDEEHLRKSARDWYQIERQSDMPSLIQSRSASKASDTN